MAAEPDDDARRALADLEARLRDLEQELLGGRDPDEFGPPVSEPVARPAGDEAPFPPKAPASEDSTPTAAVDTEALAEVQAAAEALGTGIAALAQTSAEIRVHALALRADQETAHDRLLGAARAAARAEDAAAEAHRIASGVLVEARGVTDAQAVIALRDALAAQPATRDVYVRGVEGGRAVIEVRLADRP